MVSIMPGMEARAPERTETSSGDVASPNVAPTALPISASAASTSAQAVGQLAAVGVVGRAHLGGDGEARRHRQAEARHLGEVGALAAQQLLHVGVAVGLAGAEQIDPLAGSFWPLPTWPGNGWAIASSRLPTWASPVDH